MSEQTFKDQQQAEQERDLLIMAEIEHKADIDAEYSEQQRREDKEAEDEYNSEPHY